MLPLPSAFSLNYILSVRVHLSCFSVHYFSSPYILRVSTSHGKPQRIIARACYSFMTVCEVNQEFLQYRTHIPALYGISMIPTAVGSFFLNLVHEFFFFGFCLLLRQLSQYSAIEDPFPVT